MTSLYRQSAFSILLYVTVLVLSASRLQPPSGPTPAARPPGQSAQTGTPILVTFNLSVWDKQNRPIRNLDTNHVHIWVAGHEQAINSLVQVPAHPISVIFLEDQSGSRAGQKTSYFEIPAASRFLQSLASGGNNVTVAGFAQGIKVLGQTQDPIDSTLRALSQQVPRGPTALFDALSWASKQLASQPGYRAIVIVSDGMDNASHTSFEDAVAAAQAAKVSVFFLNTIYAENEPNRRTLAKSEHDLSEAARRIGGEALLLADGRDADQDFAKIAADITFGYSVSFGFDSPNPVTKLRDLKIAVDGEHLHVLSPAGTYFLSH